MSGILTSFLNQLERDDPRINAGSIALVMGGLLCLFDFVFAWYGQTLGVQLVSLATGIILFAMVPILRWTRATEAIFGLVAVSAMICSLAPFLLTGNILFLSSAVCMPIGATICGGYRLGLVVGGVFTLASLGCAIALEQQWIIPPYSLHQLSRGVFVDSVVVLFIMCAILVAAIWLESNALLANRKSRQSDGSLKKQLAGLRLLAQATEEILNTDVPETKINELLTRFAGHLECDILLNHEFLGDTLHLRAIVGLPDAVRDNLQVIQIGENLCGRCAKTRRMVYLCGRELEKHEQGSALSALGVLTVVVVPLMFGDELVGTLAIGSTSKNSFSVEEIDFVKMIGQFVAAIRGRVQSQQKLLAAHAVAESANRAKSEFLANMSHEIRTPMTAILGYADILSEGLSKPSLLIPNTECIDTIKRNGEHLMLIINDILDLSKIEADKLVAEYMDVSPIQVAEEVIELMKVKAHAKGLVLRLSPEQPIPKTIVTDPTRLRQILLNLVGNAIKFTEVGEIAIKVYTARGDRTKLCFDIIDTGIGIRKEQVSKLFEPFEQADTSTSRKYGGTGLGLRISKRLAEILGGDLQVASEMGSGSIFSLRIAMGGPNVASSKGDHSESLLDPRGAKIKSGENGLSTCASKSTLKGLRILLVEDGPDNQRLISFVLSKSGAAVEVVENGKLALERLCVGETVDGELQSPLPIDLILMDMQMPEMDGYEATRKLRSKGFQAPIIALTAHAMESDRFKCLEAGCDVWLTKPIEKSELIGVCQQYLTTE